MGMYPCTVNVGGLYAQDVVVACVTVSNIFYIIIVLLYIYYFNLLSSDLPPTILTIKKLRRNLGAP
jgi:hypothetical protein